MLDDLATALAGTNFSFAHHAWSGRPSGDYGVYAEDAGDDFEADDVHAEKAVQCTVDYFTRDNSGTPQTTIEAALEGLNAPWYLNTVQYEDDTGYIHYEWVVTVY